MKLGLQAGGPIFLAKVSIPIAQIAAAVCELRKAVAFPSSCSAAYRCRFGKLARRRLSSSWRWAGPSLREPDLPSISSKTTPLPIPPTVTCACPPSTPPPAPSAPERSPLGLVMRKGTPTDVADELNTVGVRTRACSTHGCPADWSVAGVWRRSRELP